MTSQLKAGNALPALTGIRFFAAILVVVYHFGLPLLTSGSFVSNIVAVGHVGVNFFYILSGFIMIYSYGEKFGERDFTRRFLVARFARIYPVYALSMLVSAPIYLMSLAERNGPAAFMMKAAIAAASRVTLTQAWSKVLLGYWNTPSWSLSVEWFFYLLFAMPFVVVLSRSRPSKLVVTAVALFVLMVGIGAAHWMLIERFGDLFLYYNPLLHAPQFLLGICVGKLWLTRRLALPGWASDMVVIAVVMTMSVAIHVPHSFLHFGGLAFIFAPVIMILASGRGVAAWLLSSRPLVFLGEASYGIYILHWPVWEIVSAAYRSRGIAIDTLSFFIVYVTITIVASSLSFLYIEAPARETLRRRLLAKTTRPALS